jgi:hypothetical protein
MKLFEMEHHIVTSIGDKTQAIKSLDKINYQRIHGVDPIYEEVPRETILEIMAKEPTFIIDDTEDDILSTSISMGDTLIILGGFIFSECKLLKSEKEFLIVNNYVKSPNDIISELERRLADIQELLDSTDYKVVRAVENGEEVDEETKFQRKTLRLEYRKIDKLKSLNLDRFFGG